MTKKEAIDKYGEEWYKERLEKHKEWCKNNKKHCAEYSKSRRIELNKEGRSIDKENYWKDNIHRAKYLIKSYKQGDEKKGYGICSITVDDFLELTSNGCVYCGETDWKKLGLDRINNTKPHTKENCVCSCWNCNDKKQRKSIKQPVLQYTKSMEFVSEYPSAYDAYKQTGICSTSILNVCKRKPNFNTAGGFVWKFK